MMKILAHATKVTTLVRDISCGAVCSSVSASLQARDGWNNVGRNKLRYVGQSTGKQKRRRLEQRQPVKCLQIRHDYSISSSVINHTYQSTLGESLYRQQNCCDFLIYSFCIQTAS